MGQQVAEAAGNDATLASKFAIGEIADFVGVPDYHDAGTSQWMKADTWMGGTQVPVAAKARLGKTYSLAALSGNAGMDAYRYLNSILPPAVLPTLTAFPLQGNADSTLYALVIDNTGMSVQPTGANSGFGTNPSGQIITADGTKLFSWYQATGTAFGCKQSTDGKAWTNAALTGQPVFSNLTGDSMLSGVMNSLGECFTSYLGTQLTGAFYAGARHLLIGSDGTYSVVSRSTDGVTFNGNDSLAVLGSTTIAKGYAGWWYRNGLNAFLALANAARYSMDGGVTWNAATFNFGNPIHGMRFRPNPSDPARIACNTGGAGFQFTTNNGQTWVVRTAPFTPTTYATKGSTVLVCNDAVVHRSVDDGATWTLMAAPAGMLGVPVGVYSDANRFYILTSANQVVRSTDGITSWIVANITNPRPVLDIDMRMQYCAALDSNKVLLSKATSDPAPGLYTADGGVGDEVGRTRHSILLRFVSCREHRNPCACQRHGGRPIEQHRPRFWVRYPWGRPGAGRRSVPLHHWHGGLGAHGHNTNDPHFVRE